MPKWREYKMNCQLQINEKRKCKNKATYIIHLMGGGKDWHLCTKHYNKLKRNGVLQNLINKNRVERV